jgi:hypothetical protein
MAVSTGRLLIYTCIAGNYDELPAPLFESADIDFVCLSDAAVSVPSPWILQRLPAMPLSAPELNRYAKMHPHLLFPQHEVSLYVDGNIQVIADPRPMVASALTTRDLSLYAHPFRDCAYQESEECAAIGYAWSGTIRRQMRGYAAEGFPRGHGLHEAGVIVRRHASPGVQRLMAAWWAAYRSGVRRDQISLPFLAWKLGVPIGNLGPSDPRFTQRYFRLREGHRRPVPSRILMRGRLNRLWDRLASGLRIGPPADSN